jgi:hypothetical protein
LSKTLIIHLLEEARHGWMGHLLQVNIDGVNLLGGNKNIITKTVALLDAIMKVDLEMKAGRSSPNLQQRRVQ